MHPILERIAAAVPSALLEALRPMSRQEVVFALRGTFDPHQAASFLARLEQGGRIDTLRDVALPETTLGEILCFGADQFYSEDIDWLILALRTTIAWEGLRRGWGIPEFETALGPDEMILLLWQGERPATRHLLHPCWNYFESGLPREWTQSVRLVGTTEPVLKTASDPFSAAWDGAIQTYRRIREYYFFAEILPAGRAGPLACFQIGEQFLPFPFVGMLRGFDEQYLDLFHYSRLPWFSVFKWPRVLTIESERFLSARYARMNERWVLGGIPASFLLREGARDEVEREVEALGGAEAYYRSLKSRPVDTPLVERLLGMLSDGRMTGAGSFCLSAQDRLVMDRIRKILGAFSFEGMKASEWEATVVKCSNKWFKQGKITQEQIDSLHKEDWARIAVEISRKISDLKGLGVAGWLVRNIVAVHPIDVVRSLTTRYDKSIVAQALVNEYPLQIAEAREGLRQMAYDMAAAHDHIAVQTAAGSLALVVASRQCPSQEVSQLITDIMEATMAAYQVAVAHPDPFVSKRPTAISTPIARHGIRGAEQGRLAAKQAIKSILVPYELALSSDNPVVRANARSFVGVTRNRGYRSVEKVRNFINDCGACALLAFQMMEGHSDPFIKKLAGTVGSVFVQQGVRDQKQVPDRVAGIIAAATEVREVCSQHPAPHIQALDVTIVSSVIEYGALGAVAGRAHAAALIEATQAAYQVALTHSRPIISKLAISIRWLVARRKVFDTPRAQLLAGNMSQAALAVCQVMWNHPDPEVQKAAMTVARLGVYQGLTTVKAGTKFAQRMIQHYEQEGYFPWRSGKQKLVQKQDDLKDLELTREQWSLLERHYRVLMKNIGEWSDRLSGFHRRLGGFDNFQNTLQEAFVTAAAALVLDPQVNVERILADYLRRASRHSYQEAPLPDFFLPKNLHVVDEAEDPSD